jgi:hypothetical protein
MQIWVWVVVVLVLVPSLVAVVYGAVWFVLRRTVEGVVSLIPGRRRKAPDDETAAS